VKKPVIQILLGKTRTSGAALYLSAFPTPADGQGKAGVWPQANLFMSPAYRVYTEND
jgi:hypothetical protein